MGEFREISRRSEQYRNATRCFKVPKKHLTTFFEELVRQRGVALSTEFVIDQESILMEAFDWDKSVKGGQFWIDMENKMLKKEGIIAVESESVNNNDDEMPEGYSAIHAQLKGILEFLKNEK